MRPTLTALSLVLIALLSSCGDGGERSERGPVGAATGVSRLPYGSTRLAEDEDLYIAEPYSLVVVPAQDGSGRLREVWVSDFFANSILQFDGDGRFRKRIGRPGPGPHEFSAVTLLFLTDDDEVGAVDLRSREVKWFDRDTGELRRFVRYQTGRMGRSPPVKVDGGTPALVFPLLDPTSRTSLGIFGLDSQTWAYTGPFPGPYRQSIEQGRGAFAALFPTVLLDRLDEATLLVAFAGVDTLYQYDLRERSAIPFGKVPRLFRRGIEGECRFAYETPGGDTTECAAAPTDQFSVMKGAWVLRDGRIAVVHVDCRGEGRPPARVYTCRGYLSVLDRDGDVACVDLPVPGGDDSGAFADLQEDILYTLDRRLTDLSTETWLLQIPIPSMAECPESHLARGWQRAGER